MITQPLVCYMDGCQERPVARLGVQADCSFYTPEGGSVVATVWLVQLVCPTHLDKIVVQDVVTDQGLRSLLLAAYPELKPDLSSARLTWHRIRELGPPDWDPSVWA